MHNYAIISREMGSNYSLAF